MNMMIRHPAHFVRAKQGESLTEQDFRRYVPSVYAKEAHESRSDRYTFIPTIEILRGMYRQGFIPVEARQSRTRDASRREYTKHWIKLRHRDHAAVVGDVVPELSLLNSYDGTSAYVFHGGLFRLICSNGMVVSEGFCASVHVSHRGSVVEDAIEGSYKVMDDVHSIVDFSKRTKDIHLSNEQQRVYAAQALKLLGKEDTVAIPAILSARRPGDDQNTLWHTFQRVQENAMKGGLPSYTTREVVRRGRTFNVPVQRSTRAINGIDANISVNQGLWELTNQFAQMYGG